MYRNQTTKRKISKDYEDFGLNNYKKFILKLIYFNTDV